MFVAKTHTGCAALLFVSTALLPAQDNNPLAGDPQAIEAGKYHFRINCAVCHGLNARGGGRGPDLTRARKKLVVIGDSATLSPSCSERSTTALPEQTCLPPSAASGSK